MFGQLTAKFNAALRKITGRGMITEGNVREAMDEVRTALLEADVHHDVVEEFTAACMKKAVGAEVLRSLKPGQMMIKIVYDELVALMKGAEGEEPGLLEVHPGPTIIMMCGLQGSGKTTTCGKLAAHYKKKGRKVMLAAADLQRPAAVDQLRTLAEQVETTVEGRGMVVCYAEPDKVAEYGKAVGVAVDVCKRAVDTAKRQGLDVVILDTAGRLHINDSLMGELRQVNSAVKPHNVILVIDAMTGQDAVNSAKAFNSQLELDGVILTKYDSDTRGGAALTVRKITGKPIKFVGVGEKLDALEEFHAERVAQRILDMGDVLTLVEKMQERVSAEDADALQDKMAKGSLTLDDFLQQMEMLRKMGSMKSLMGMLPGVGSQLQNLDMDEGQIDTTRGVIHSMTKEERRDPEVLNNSRRRRIARGSGTTTNDVSHLVKGFDMVKNFGRQMSGMGILQKVKALAGMGRMDLSSLASGKAPKLEVGRDDGPKKFKERRKKSR